MPREEPAFPGLCGPRKARRKMGAKGGVMYRPKTRLQWSKLKKIFKQRLADSLRNRLDIHVTEYNKANTMDVGRGWLTLDGNEVCSIQIPSFYDDRIAFESWVLDFGRAVGEYVAMTVEEALESPHPTVQALAFLDKKMGKRRLQKIDKESLHDFPRITYELRCDVEGIVPDTDRPSKKVTS